MRTLIDVEHLCPGCMGRWEDTEKPCPRCGFSPEDPGTDPRSLAAFTVLGGRYLTGRKIGTGGFGITYIAMDLIREEPVAIKEFFPVSLAKRQGERIVSLPGEDGRYFREALRSFRREADILARFKGVKGIVAYRDFIEENGTSYLVMDYVEGVNLKQHMRRTGETFSQRRALEKMEPILQAVEAMHSRNILHRDISPENLILKPDGTLTLIDFGAAREFSLDEEENLTVILKHGYAPEEQYHSGSRQGPWTDLYACCAVLYQMVSGILPQDAASRRQKDDLLPLDEMEDLEVTEHFARVIEKGMTIHATERYPSIRALMKELYPEEEPAGESKTGEKEEGQGETAPETEKVAGEKTTPLAEGRNEAADEKAAQREAGMEKSDVGTKSWESQKFQTAGSERKESGIGSYKRPLTIIGCAALLLILAFVFMPRGAVGDEGVARDSEEAAEVYTDPMEGRYVWLATDITDASNGTRYLIEYNDHGYVSYITSYNVSPYNYASILGGSYGVDASFGEISSDFYYEYDGYGRILSATQTTYGSDSDYQYTQKFDYLNESSDIPIMIQLDTMQENFSTYYYMENDDGSLTGVSTKDGPYDLEIDFIYEDGLICGVRETVYCPEPEDPEVLEQFVSRYYTGDDTVFFYGVNYEISESGELGRCEWIEGEEVFAEMTMDIPPEDSLADSLKVDSVSGLYRYVSPDSSGETDDYGNVLQYDDCYICYTEYSVDDGIYTATGNESAPSGYGSQTSDADTSTGTGYTESPNPAISDAHTEVIEMLTEYGMDAEKGYAPEYYGSSEDVVNAVDQGLVHAAFLPVSKGQASLTAQAGEGYFVFPPEEWFEDDETAWTLFASSADTWWELTGILMDEGYYSPDDKAYEFLSNIRETGGDRYLIVHAETTLRFELAEVYLTYWAEETGSSFELYDDETGEQLSMGLG